MFLMIICSRQFMLLVSVWYFMIFGYFWIDVWNMFMGLCLCELECFLRCMFRQVVSVRLIFFELLFGLVFFEFIECKGNYCEGFGEGNFGVLFELMECDQINCGVLEINLV